MTMLSIQIKVKRKGNGKTWEETPVHNYVVNTKKETTGHFAQTLANEYGDGYEVRMNYPDSYQGYYFAGFGKGRFSVPE